MNSGLYKIGFDSQRFGQNGLVMPSAYRRAIAQKEPSGYRFDAVLWINGQVRNLPNLGSLDCLPSCSRMAGCKDFAKLISCVASKPFLMAS